MQMRANLHIMFNHQVDKVEWRISSEEKGGIGGEEICGKPFV